MLLMRTSPGSLKDEYKHAILRHDEEVLESTSVTCVCEEDDDVCSWTERQDSTTGFPEYKMVRSMC